MVRFDLIRVYLCHLSHTEYYYFTPSFHFTHPRNTDDVTFYLFGALATLLLRFGCVHFFPFVAVLCASLVDSALYHCQIFSMVYYSLPPFHFHTGAE